MSSHPTSIWRRSPNKLRQNEIWLEFLSVTGLFAAALILFLVNLGELPLLDLNEGIAAQVAKEIFQRSDSFSQWIFPTLWGEPYLAQPPLIHGLIAIAYKIAGVSEFTTRLPGAFLGVCSVLLVYNIGREIFVARFPALCSALIYLTCLPIVRYSRLAMSDGALLCFELITIWAVLRSRRDLRWSWMAGMGLGLMSLIKGAIAIQILVVVVGFLLWDTPRLLTSLYFLSGFFLGLTPAIGWYAALCLHYHYELNNISDIVSVFLAKISPAELKSSFSAYYYLIQSLQYIFPWTVVMSAGLKLTTRNLHWGWGKLITVWMGIYLALVLLVFDRHAWSILPLYPGLALAGGRQLYLIRNLPSYIDYPQIWTYSFALMAFIAAFAGLHWGISDYIDFYLPFICGSLAVTFAATAIAISHQEKQFIPLLFWGLFVSMFLFFVSPHWIWELKAFEPVKPIAASIEQYTPERQIIYTSMSQRPSLGFYSDRQIISKEINDLKNHWQNDPQHGLDVYLLINSATAKKLNIPAEAIFASPYSQSGDWVLAINKS